MLVLEGGRHAVDFLTRNTVASLERFFWSAVAGQKESRLEEGHTAIPRQ
jgi:hypothetical protein